MNDQHDQDRNNLRDSWIESLLISATQRQDHSQRVAQAMNRIDSMEPVAEPVSRELANRRNLVIWPTLGLAIALLIALFLVLPSSSRTAVAAVQRSLHVAGDLVSRSYSLQVDYQPQVGNSFRIDNDLYVRGSNSFALRHPGVVPGKSLWLGKDGQVSWVLPAIGPVIKGDSTVLHRYLRSREELNTPYLHITTLLQRMLSQGYQLKTLADERITVTKGHVFDCHHIRAESSNLSETGLPETIELWTSLESDMVVRLIAHWQLEEGNAGRKSIVLTFRQEELNLPDAWFTAEGHYEGERPVIDSPN